jgi:hypothetical protein
MNEPEGIIISVECGKVTVLNDAERYSLDGVTWQEECVFTGLPNRDYTVYVDDAERSLGFEGRSHIWIETEEDGNIRYICSHCGQYRDEVTFLVRFIDCDGTVLSEEYYNYDNEVIPPDDPENKDDDEYTYKFTGWDKEIQKVNDNAVYTAVYDKEEKTLFTPGDINGDGTVNNKDIVALFRYTSGNTGEVNVIALDPNGDGTVNNKDIVFLFRYVSGAAVILSDKPYEA